MKNYIKIIKSKFFKKKSDFVIDYNSNEDDQWLLDYLIDGLQGDHSKYQNETGIDVQYLLLKLSIKSQSIHSIEQLIEKGVSLNSSVIKEIGANNINKDTLIYLAKTCQNNDFESKKDLIISELESIGAISKPPPTTMLENGEITFKPLSRKASRKITNTDYSDNAVKILIKHLLSANDIMLLCDENSGGNYIKLEELHTNYPDIYDALKNKSDLCLSGKSAFSTIEMQSLEY